MNRLARFGVKLESALLVVLQGIMLTGWILLDFDTSIMFLSCYKSEGDVDLLKNVVCQFLSTCLEVM